MTALHARPGWQFSATGATLPVEDRDYPAWRKGRAHYGVWLIDADTAPVRQRLAQVRAHMAPLLADSQRQPHITLFVCGFIADVVAHDDDFTPAMLAAQQAALQALSLAPFELTIGAIDSFDSAVFLRIEDPTSALAPLRRALGTGGREIRQSAYVPHLTVGLYQGAFDKQVVAQRLLSLPAQTPIPLRVERLQFAHYRARDVGGPLLPRGDHVLETVL